MEVYLTRHGEKNEKSAKDSFEYTLTEKGAEDIFNASCKIQDDLEKKDITAAQVAIVVSPAYRTKQSGAIIAQNLGIDNTVKDIVVAEFLNEVDIGVFDKEYTKIQREFDERTRTGNNVSDPHSFRTADFIRDIKEKYQAEFYKTPMDEPRPYGESARNVLDRTDKGLRKLLPELEKQGYKAAVVVTHRSVFTMAAKSMLGDKLSDSWVTDRITHKTDIPTSSVQVFSGNYEKGFENQGFINGRIIQMGDSSKNMRA